MSENDQLHVQREQRARKYLDPFLPKPADAASAYPHLTLTFAQSLDARIALHGKPLLLSSPESMVVTHLLRATHDAIMVGVNTIVTDNPSLTTRIVKGPSPRAVILDSTLRCPLNAKIFSPTLPSRPELNPIIITTEKSDPTKRKAFEKAGATVLIVPVDYGGRCQLAAAFQALKTECDINSVMIEGGATVIQGVLSEANRSLCCGISLVVTVAPVIVGDGVTAYNASSIDTLVDVRWERFGQDGIMAARIAKRVQ
ncbi:2,5-diamino-6-(ribosylamino)-4(3H)-pyrimidinone 5'-phosphate reductase [Gaertneriomyces sp. JEL0708]|nr:2,5-diamino-6-(ribosylamino)-4(3H)-pyrimidinone 5'-phosphate reductase [Gaertneriomyces sp. JEL0708]